MSEKSYPEVIVCPEQTKVFALNLTKCRTLPDDAYGKDGMVPVRIFLTPVQLSEILRLNIDLTGIIQNWIEDDLAVYREAANE